MRSFAIAIYALALLTVAFSAPTPIKVHTVNSWRHGRSCRHTINGGSGHITRASDDDCHDDDNEQPDDHKTSKPHKFDVDRSGGKHDDIEKGRHENQLDGEFDGGDLGDDSPRDGRFDEESSADHRSERRLSERQISRRDYDDDPSKGYYGDDSYGDEPYGGDYDGDKYDNEPDAGRQYSDDVYSVYRSPYTQRDPSYKTSESKESYGSAKYYPKDSTYSQPTCTQSGSGGFDGIDIDGVQIGMNSMIPPIMDPAATTTTASATPSATSSSASPTASGQ